LPLARSVCAKIIFLFQSDVTQTEGKSGKPKGWQFHFISASGSLSNKTLFAERPKPMKYREIVVDGTGLMGPDPRTSGV
jgi:hypothetical protein